MFGLRRLVPARGAGRSELNSELRVPSSRGAPPSDKPGTRNSERRTVTRRNPALLALALCLLLSIPACATPRLTPFEQGVEFMDYGDYPRAIEQFKAIARRGETLAVCYNLGVCYHDLKDYDQAVYWYERALEIDPRDGNSLVNLGLVYLEQGRDIAALARFRQAAEVERDRAYPLVAQAIYYQRVGRLDRARELYEEAATREERSGYLWFHYATLHEQDQRFGDAAQAYEKSIQYDSTNPAAFEGAARCYFKLRNWRKAIQHYDWVIHLQPDRPRFYVAAADTLVEMGRYERAVRYLWTARTLTRHNDPEISRRLIELYPKLTEAELARLAAQPPLAEAGGNGDVGE
jgi:tetratricopeptide (TPR) repeat protein